MQKHVCGGLHAIPYPERQFLSIFSIFKLPDFAVVSYCCHPHKSLSGFAPTDVGLLEQALQGFPSVPAVPELAALRMTCPAMLTRFICLLPLGRCGVR